MDVAVTGASGLIGSRLVDALVGRGDRVLRLVRHEPRGTDEIGWDPRAGRIDAAGLEGVDAVVHLAGEPIGAKRWSAAQKATILESRVDGTALVAATLAAAQRPPKVLVSGSAIGFYGDRGDEQLDETSARGTGFLADVVVAWETATAPAEAAGVRVAHARTGLVLAPDGGALGPMLRLFRLGLGGRLGSGRQWWSWISIDDEVAALVHLLDHDVSGPVDLVAPQPVTNADFTRSLARALHRPAVLPVPAFGPRLLLGRQLADELLFASQRVAPTRLLASGFAFAHADVDTALAAVLA